MKNKEFYTRTKARSEAPAKPIVPPNTWWLFILGTALIILLGPFLSLKYRGVVSMSFDAYVYKVIIIGAIILPLEAIILWYSQIREEVNRRKGYDLVGKFEVEDKTFSFNFYYLKLKPGSSHKIKVSRRLFESTRLGDFILIRRNALGDIKELARLSGMRHRIRRAEAVAPFN